MNEEELALSRARRALEETTGYVRLLLERNHELQEDLRLSRATLEHAAEATLEGAQKLAAEIAQLKLERDAARTERDRLITIVVKLLETVHRVAHT